MEPSLAKKLIGKYKNIKHFLRAVKATATHGYPARKLTVIGVTGTNGKTTTTYLIHHILKTNNQKAVRISSTGIYYPKKNSHIPTKTQTTTPLASEIQSIFSNMLKDGIKYAVIECSSLGLDQHRLLGSNMHTGVLTNLSHDHLDYHHTFERYKKAKSKLLKMAKFSVINADDGHFQYFKSNSKGKVTTYGILNKAEISPDSLQFKLPHTSIYNHYNILAGAAAANTLGISPNIIKKAIYSFKYPPGHLQEMKLGAKFKVFVDFAHTPNGLKNVLSYLKKANPQSKIILVFGCEGSRDTIKRPLMGEIADNLASTIILTSCDPRTEGTDKINSQILSGIKKHKNNKNLYIINDRQAAITKALQVARKGDVVLTSGKGHESTMQIGNQKTPWSEVRAIKRAFLATS